MPGGYGPFRAEAAHWALGAQPGPVTDTQAEHRPPAWILHPADRDSYDLFAELADEDDITRYTAVHLISETAINDPAGRARAARPVGAENLRRLGRRFARRRRLGHANGAWWAGLGSGWCAMIFDLWA